MAKSTESRFKDSGVAESSEVPPGHNLCGSIRCLRYIAFQFSCLAKELWVLLLLPFYKAVPLFLLCRGYRIFAKYSSRGLFDRMFCPIKGSGLVWVSMNQEVVKKP